MLSKVEVAKYYLFVLGACRRMVVGVGGGFATLMISESSEFTIRTVEIQEERLERPELALVARQSLPTHSPGHSPTFLPDSTCFTAGRNNLHFCVGARLEGLTDTTFPAARWDRWALPVGRSLHPVRVFLTHINAREHPERAHTAAPARSPGIS